MTKIKTHYFEPSEAPKEAIEAQQANRKIKIRFRNMEDVREFERLTGINLQIGKFNKIKLPLGTNLTNFF